MNDTAKTLVTVGLFLVTAAAIRKMFTGPTYNAPEAIPELFKLNEEDYFDATIPQRAAVQMRLEALKAIAQEVADAPGFLGDDENRLFAALSRLRSRYEVLWMSKVFVGVDWRTLNVFSITKLPNAGTYMNVFLSNREWEQVVNMLAPLPKY
jgi:hypothetical protein